MEKPSLTEVQRKQYMRLLTQAQNRAEEDLEGNYDLEDRVNKEVSSKLAKELGTSKLVARIRMLRKQTEDAENELERLGFYCDSKSIELRDKLPKVLQKALDAAIEKAKHERDEVSRNYRVSMLNLVAVTSAEDAKNIVENLL